MHAFNFSILHKLKDNLSQNSSRRKLVKAFKLVKQYGYDPNQLYIINPSYCGHSDRNNQFLRFFKFPISLGYLIQHKLDIIEDLILSEILKQDLLQPFSSYPLQMNVDQAIWDFYGTVNESSPPSQVQLNITNRCVNRCYMCRKYKWPQEDMPIITFREIVEDMQKMGFDLLILSGGEPFLHRDFDEILDMVKDMPTLAFTSGTVPLSFDKMRNLKRVQFSVDALDPRIYRIIRGPGNVETVKKNIRKAKEAGCDVTITTVIQKANVFHVPDIMEFCEKENIPFLPSVVHSYDNLSFYNLNDRPLPPLCVVPFYHCLIDPLGDIFVCCHHHEDNTDYEKIDRRFVLGNVFNSRFSDIWFSNKAKEIKKGLIENRAPFCQGCYRYLLENDVTSFIRACDSTISLPYTHTYFFPLEIMHHLRVPE